MPPRWNTWSGLQAVQLDYEKTPKERAVRLAAPVARVGDPVRIAVAGVEIEGRIAAIADSVLYVKVRATQLKAQSTRTKRKRTA